MIKNDIEVALIFFIDRLLIQIGKSIMLPKNDVNSLNHKRKQVPCRKDMCNATLPLGKGSGRSHGAVNTCNIQNAHLYVEMRL